MFAPRCAPRRRRSGAAALGTGRRTRTRHRPRHPRRGAVSAAVDLPAPVLADLLGLSISAATRWGAHTARDDADYLAARIANPPPRPDGWSPFARDRRFDVGTRAYPSPVTARTSWSGRADAMMTNTALPLVGLVRTVRPGSAVEQLVLIGQPRPIRVPQKRWQSWLDDPVVVARFEVKRYKRAHGLCWVWIGGVSSTGHGSFRAASLSGPTRRGTVPAHLFAYQLAHGVIPRLGGPAPRMP